LNDLARIRKLRCGACGDRCTQHRRGWRCYRPAVVSGRGGDGLSHHYLPVLVRPKLWDAATGHLVRNLYGFVVAGAIAACSCGSLRSSASQTLGLTDDCRIMK
jgi:hypothetical protein